MEKEASKNVIWSIITIFLALAAAFDQVPGTAILIVLVSWIVFFKAEEYEEKRKVKKH